MTTTIQHQSHWFSIRTDDQGNEFLASTGDEVLVVPLTASGEMILLVEPSAAFGPPVLILPGDGIKAGRGERLAPFCVADCDGSARVHLYSFAFYFHDGRSMNAV